MKTCRISKNRLINMESIWGDTKPMIIKELLKAGFDLSKEYQQYRDFCTQELVFQQKESESK